MLTIPKNNEMRSDLHADAWQGGCNPCSPTIVPACQDGLPEIINGNVHVNLVSIETGRVLATIKFALSLFLPVIYALLTTGHLSWAQHVPNQHYTSHEVLRHAHQQCVRCTLFKLSGLHTCV